jgi:hypothetical protein
VITGFWAAVTVGASSTGYIMTRTGGNLKDCANEHVIDRFMEVRARYSFNQIL